MCGRAATKSVPEMLSSIEGSSVELLKGGQDVPVPCPLALLLLSAPVAAVEAPTLGSGAIVFDSWAVVISESVVETIQNAARNFWTDFLSQGMEANARRLECGPPGSFNAG